jgi:hypothetical protein
LPIHPLLDIVASFGTSFLLAFVIASTVNAVAPKAPAAVLIAVFLGSVGAVEIVTRYAIPNVEIAAPGRTRLELATRWAAVTVAGLLVTQAVSRYA